MTTTSIACVLFMGIGIAMHHNRITNLYVLYFINYVLFSVYFNNVYLSLVNVSTLTYLYLITHTHSSIDSCTQQAVVYTNHEHLLVVNRRLSLIISRTRSRHTARYSYCSGDHGYQCYLGNASI